MGGYRDEYVEDLDEYEDDETEGERYEGYEGYEDEYEEGYEEEEEEDSQPPKEVQDFLVLRQSLKEEKRKQLKKELGTASSSSRDKKNSVFKSNDNYGSFFGSSQPVIAPRVIQESKSLLENPHLLDKATKSKNMVTKSTVPDFDNSKSQSTGQTPKVVNQVLKKVQIIKQNRDYSFLDFDDAEPTKDPPRKSEAPPAHNKDYSSPTVRKVVVPSQHQRDVRKSTSINGLTRHNVASPKMISSDPRKQHPKGSNGSVAHDRDRIPNKTSNSRSSTVAAHDRSRIPNKNSNGNGAVVAAHDRNRIPSNGNGAVVAAHDKNRIPSKISSGPGRPLVVSKSVPSKIPTPPAKSSASLTHKTAPTRSQPSASSKPQVPISNQTARRPEELRKKEGLLSHRLRGEELRKMKMLPRQAEELRKQMESRKQAAPRHEESRKQHKVLPRHGGVPGLKPKAMQGPTRNTVQKRPTRPFDDEEDVDDEVDDPYAFQKELRALTGYNPSGYRDEGDDRNMEANFHEIAREEKRSALIAKREDEEELRKIEEEERRERRQRMLREAKKQKII